MSSAKYPSSGASLSTPGNNTPAAPENVTAAGGVLPNITTQRQMLFISGDGGPVTITAVPAIAASTVFGAELILIGADPTKTVTINSDPGTLLNGTITLSSAAAPNSAGSALYLVWNGSAWIEISRR